MTTWNDPVLRAESERLGGIYQEKVQRAEKAEAFWQTLGQRTMSVQDLFEAVDMPTVNRAWREATKALSDWRQFRAACEMS